MTEAHKRKNASHIIIHGDCWPVVSATEHVLKAMHPTVRCKTTFRLTELLQGLARSPDVPLVLCLRPREHIFLFYALQNALLSHPVLVISDELLFSDRVVLHNWGGIPAMSHDELNEIVARIWSGGFPEPDKSRLGSFISDPRPVTGYFSVPLIFNSQKRLMNYMELLMFRATTNCGVTAGQQKLIQEVHCGLYTLSGMKDILHKSEKRIFQDKYSLMVKLGMKKNRLRELLYGTRFCLAEQRTEFLAPGKTEVMSEKAMSLPSV
ncbi:transcriptional regulator [Salmonella enterica subsp. salamae]|nr:transcriptional regulator [Salmonella enterica subsp. salamae]